VRQEPHRFHNRALVPAGPASGLNTNERMNVYCKLQSTQLDRVISKFDVRKGREASSIHQWFTAVVLLS